MNGFIASITIIIMMLFFVLVMFRNIIRRINQNAKKYFINKLDDYDYIAEEKDLRFSKEGEELRACGCHQSRASCYGYCA